MRAALLFAVPLLCCAGLPLLLAAGLSVGLAAVVGGLALAGVALAVAVGLVILRPRTRRAAACHVDEAREAPGAGATEGHR